MADRLEILTGARDNRIEEVLSYQINIDNYRLAIVKAAADPDLADFAKQLQGLLATSILEQKKAKVMLDVIQDQLASLATP